MPLPLTTDAKRLLQGSRPGCLNRKWCIWLSSRRLANWKLVDALREPAQVEYWSAVTPELICDSDVQRNDGVERLMKAGRPRAAFSCIRYEPG